MEKRLTHLGRANEYKPVGGEIGWWRRKRASVRAAVCIFSLINVLVPHCNDWTFRSHCL